MMSKISRYWKIGMKPAALALTAFFHVALPATADMVDFVQMSEPVGIVASNLSEAVVGGYVTTVLAPASSASLRLCGWYDQYGGRYTDGVGVSTNPARVLVLESLVMTARYTNQSLDVDVDGVPDWYELFHYGMTNLPAGGDSDGDGYSLSEEWYRGYNPCVSNGLVYRLFERSVPVGIVADAEFYIGGATGSLTTASWYGDIGTNRFAYWQVDGLRRGDEMGRALDPVTTMFSPTQRFYLVEARYVCATNDTDLDGVLDWYELNQYGDLSHGGSEDADGDGWDLRKECQADTSPRLANTLARSEVLQAQSESFRFVTASDLYYTEQSSPTGRIAYRDEVFQPGAVVTARAENVYGALRFTYWTLNGVIQTNGLGGAANPLVFNVTTDIAAVAHLVDQSLDGDGDSIPDWYELLNYTSTNVPMGIDSDGDGYGMYEEWYRGYDPQVSNSLVYRVWERAVPSGIVANAECYVGGMTGTMVVASRYGDLGTNRFAGWQVDGVRQSDAMGRALDPITVTFNPTQRFYLVEAQYVCATNDTDADGVLDWYELNQYGDLSHDAREDADGDGWDLKRECQADTSPRLANTLERSEVIQAQSGPSDFVVSVDWRYVEQSSPTGWITYRDEVFQPGAVVTARAESAYGTLRFTYWKLNGAVQTNGAGAAINPLIFNITTDTTAVAYLVDQSSDVDQDGVADWYELFHYGTTNMPATSDSDGDGYRLYEECYRGYDPHSSNSLVYRVWERSVPSGIVANTEFYIGGVTGSTVTATRYGDLGTNRFTGWQVDGVRQVDAMGRSLDPVIVTFHPTQRFYLVEERYVCVTNDTDADGVLDWYELNQYGDLSHSGTEDADGDGWDLKRECQADTSPRLINTNERSEVVLAQSEPMEFWQRDFFTVEEAAIYDGVYSNVFTEMPPAVGCLSFGADSYPALGDWDGDGDLDLWVGSATGHMAVYENCGSITVLSLLDATTNLSALAGAWSGVRRPRPYLGDWNRDGFADLVLGGETNIVRLIVSPGRFLPPQPVTVNSVLDTGRTSCIPALLDVNADGWSDLLAMGPDGLVAVYTNTRNASLPFVPPVWTNDLFGTIVPKACGMTVADVNDDRVPDVLVSDKDGRIWEFDGSTGGIFGLVSKVYGGTGVGFANRLAASAGDLDGDGDTDLIAGFAEGGLLYLRNPSLHLRVFPNLITMLAGETQPFTVVNGGGAVTWRLAVNGSGGSLGTNGLYTAGRTTAVDSVEAVIGARRGLAYVNVRAGAPAHAMKSVVIAGRKNVQDPLWPVTAYLGDFGYNSLRYLGFRKQDLCYLRAEINSDVDGNGVNDDVYAASLWTNACWTFTNWVNGAEELCVYLVDHGGTNLSGGRFHLREGEELTAMQLDSWLDALQDRYNTAVTVILDFCQAGMFAEGLAYTGVARRTVIAACGAQEPSYFVAGGLVSFSDGFFSGLTLGLDVADSFRQGGSAMSSYQTPLMTGGGAAGVHIGVKALMGRDIPVIGDVCAKVELSGATLANLWVDNVSGAHDIARVWGQVVSPSFQPDPRNPVLNVASFDLVRNGATRRYSGSYDGFTENGVYKVMIYARDVWGAVSLPRVAWVTQSDFDERAVVVLGYEPDAGRRRIQEFLAGKVWVTLQARQIPRSRICCLTPTGFVDFNGDSVGDAWGTLTKASLSGLVTNTLAVANKLDLVVVGGERIGTSLRLNATETLTPLQLDGWLDTFQAGGKPVVSVLEFSGSGSFVPFMAPPGGAERITVASSAANQRSVWCDDLGRVSFLYSFCSRVFNGEPVGTAFTEAATMIRQASGKAAQASVLDDAGRGVADRRYIGSAYMTGGNAPVIGEVVPDSVATGSSALVWARSVLDVEGVSNVWCTVTAPWYDGSMQLEKVPLSWNEALARYETSLSALTCTGVYVVTIFAENVLGDSAVPQQCTVLRIDTDSDGNGIPDWWTLLYFGGSTNAVADVDQDQDGLDNWQEWSVGTDPTNAKSVFGFTAPAVGSGSPFTNRPVVVYWPSVAGHVYSLQWGTNLIEGLQEFTSGIPATPAMNVFTDEMHRSVPSGLYRVKAER